MKETKKKLLDAALTFTGRMHWHSLFFWLLERYSDLAEEIANERYQLPPEEEKKLIDEILKRGRLEAARREAFEDDIENASDSAASERPDYK